MTARRAIVLGTVVFLAIIVLQAPASLLRTALDGSPVTLLEPRGTFWNGNARLLVERRPLGEVSWAIDAVTVFKGKLRYHLALVDVDHDLTGAASAGLSGQSATLSGRVAHGAVNRWLDAYNIVLSGEFTLDAVELGFADGLPERAGGEVRWTGGSVTYTLAGETSTGNLPEMTALLGPGPEAEVLASGAATPLLKLELLDNGFAKIGVTKLLTKMLNTPWPGADPDDAVVLEVEEQVF